MPEFFEKPPEVILPTLNCKKCGWIWTARKSGDAPVKCPRCQSRSWWIPRKPKEMLRNE